MTRWFADGVFSWTSWEKTKSVETIAHENPDTGQITTLVRIHIPIVRDGYSRSYWYIDDRTDLVHPEYYGQAGSKELSDPLLTIVVSPEPTIEPVSVLKPGEAGFGKIRLAVIRLDSAASIAIDDESPRAGGMVGYGTPPAAPEQARTSTLPVDDTEFNQPGYEAVDLFRIERKPNSTRFYHQNGEWDVTVSYHDIFKPAAHRSYVEPRGSMAGINAQSAYAVYVTYTDGIDITANQRTSAAEALVFAVPFSIFIKYLYLRDIAARSLVELRAHPLQMRDVDALGLRGAGEYEEQAVELQYGTLDSLALDIFIMGVENTPAIGPIFEVGHLAYGMITGYDMFGRKLSQTDVGGMGLGAMMALLPHNGLSGFLGKCKALTDFMFNKAGPARLIAAGALLPSARQFLERAMPPMALEALRYVDMAEVEALLARYNLSSLTNADIARMMQDFARLLMAGLKKIPQVDSLPRVLAFKHFAAIHPEDFPYFTILRDEGKISDFSALVAAYDTALAAADPGLFKRYVLDTLGPQAWQTCLSELHHRAGRALIDFEKGGFRLASHGDNLAREMLARRWARRKEFLQGAPDMGRYTIEWILSLPAGSRVRAVLIFELGPRYETILRQIAYVQKYAVSAQQAAIYQRFIQTSFMLPYTTLRGRLVAEAGKIGHLFQCDHILESRFFRRGVIGNLPFHSDDWQAILVPYNGEVLRGLLRNRVTSALYTHTQKTALTRRYLPYGKEVYYSVQELFDTYQYIYVECLGLPYDFWAPIAEPIFRQLARARKEAIEIAQLPLKDLSLMVKNKTLAVKDLPEVR